MQKHRVLLISTIVLFLTINTNYYWEGRLGMWAFPVIAVLFIACIVLVIALFRQIYFAISEKFKARSRLYLIGIMVSALLISNYLPAVFDPESLEAKDLLVAHHVGTASCSLTIKLKQGNEFQERSVCFAIDKIKGTYTVHHDTIRFDGPNIKDTNYTHRFAIIKNEQHPDKKTLGTLYLYRGMNDTIPVPLIITKNELVKR